jgi:inner membrane protein involved in colicin E2 resistance
MLAALPVLACVLAGFTHREAGAVAAVGLLRGMLAGMGSFVLFCQLIATLVEPYGITPAFAAAALAAALLQALTVYSVHSTLRRQSSAASVAVAQGAGSLGRQSS